MATAFSMSSPDWTSPERMTELAKDCTCTRAPGSRRLIVAASPEESWATEISITAMPPPAGSRKKILVSPAAMPWITARVLVRMMALATPGWEMITSPASTGRSTMIDLLTPISIYCVRPISPCAMRRCGEVAARAGAVSARTTSTAPDTRASRSDRAAKRNFQALDIYLTSMTGEDDWSGAGGAAGFSRAETEVPEGGALRGALEVTDWDWP